MDTPELSQQQLDQEAAILSQKIANEAANDGMGLVLGSQQSTVSDLIESLLRPLFIVLCPAWDIQQSEIKALASAYTPIVTKYFPDIDGENIPPELTGLLVTIAIVGPRMNKPRVIKTVQAKEVNNTEVQENG